LREAIADLGFLHDRLTDQQLQAVADQARHLARIYLRSAIGVIDK
jgi:hypothetical protein